MDHGECALRVTVSPLAAKAKNFSVPKQKLFNPYINIGFCQHLNKYSKEKII